MFGDLSDALLKRIAARSITRQLRTREILFSEHDEASGLYIVVAGQFRSIRQSVKGREQVISTERAGAILAVVPVINGGTFYSTMIEDTPCQVLCIEKAFMRELCREHTEMLWKLARVLAHTVRHHAQLIETLALRNVDQRVAQHLFTVCQERGFRDEDGCTIELTMSRKDMASRIGSTREVVSRALAHLQKSGLIRVQGKAVKIPDIRALSAFAGAEHDLEKLKLPSELSSEML